MTSRFTSRLPYALCVVTALSACAGNSASSSAAVPAAAAQPAVAPRAAGALPAGVTVSMVAVGDSIFHKASCQRCHGMDAKGTARAPDLTDAQWSQISGTYPEIVQIITTGVPKAQVKMAGAPFGMNPRGGTPALTEAQINQVAAYVYTLSPH
jgi:mono/diheme cytochrome c family protein